MLINKEKELSSFRDEFLAFLKRNRYSLQSFTAKFNEEINQITKLERENNYGLIWHRLNTCKKIDPDFFQKLVNLIDAKMFIQKNREEIVISKRF